MRVTVVEIEAFLRADSFSFSHGLELLERVYGRTGQLSRYKYAQFVPNTAREDLKRQLAEAIRLLSTTDKPAEDLLEDITDQVDQVPLKIRQTKTALKRLYKRSSFVHASMVQEAFGDADQGKLFSYAKEMMEDIQPQIDHYLNIISTYEKSGRIVGQNSLEADKAVELTKRINSLRSSISRYRRLLREQPKELKKRYYQQKLDELQEKLTSSQLELDNL
jgi:hypothetical protein